MSTSLGLIPTPSRSTMRQAYAPLVWQRPYSGIEFPDPLWAHGCSGVGKPYSLDQAEHMIGDTELMATFDGWVERFTAHVQCKGQVPPNRWRAFDHEAPGHLMADLKSQWREMRMPFGAMPAGTSRGPAPPRAERR